MAIKGNQWENVGTCSFYAPIRLVRLASALVPLTLASRILVRFVLIGPSRPLLMAEQSAVRSKHVRYQVLGDQK